MGSRILVQDDRPPDDRAIDVGAIVQLDVSALAVETAVQAEVVFPR